MDKQNNFEDNIFILNVRIRMLRDILCLEVDPEIFREKTLEDLFFVDYALGCLLEKFTVNRRFIDREEALDKLAELEWQFDRLLEGAGSRFPEAAQRFSQCKNNSAQRRRGIDGIRAPEEQAASEPVVSSSELNELLREL